MIQLETHIPQSSDETDQKISITLTGPNTLIISVRTASQTVSNGSSLHERISVSERSLFADTLRLFRRVRILHNLQSVAISATQLRGHQTLIYMQEQKRNMLHCWIKISRKISLSHLVIIVATLLKVDENGNHQESTQLICTSCP